MNTLFFIRKTFNGRKSNVLFCQETFMPLFYYVDMVILLSLMKEWSAKAFSLTIIL